MCRFRFLTLSVLVVFLVPIAAQAQDSRIEYRVVATTKTSTLEKEMNQAAEAGFRFASTMGGETAVGGKEVVVVMSKSSAEANPGRRIYRVLATNRTSTMQKEMQQLGDEGFTYMGQSVSETTFGGKEVLIIMENISGQENKRKQYKLLATSRTSTMQKELNQEGEAGFRILGLTVAKTSFGGDELVCIMGKW